MVGKFSNTYILFVISVFFIILSSFSHPGEDSVRDTDYTLFKIERSRDSDEVFYDVNLISTGELNTRNPIQIYWIKKTKGGKKDGLTWIQKKFGYGLKYEKISSSEARFQFVSNINRSFILKKNNKGTFKVFAVNENTVLELKKLYIQFDGGTFLSPKISRVELHAINTETWDLVLEIIRP